MEGTLQRVQRVKGLLTALASQLSSKIKDEIDSTTAKINHVKKSVTEALLSWERISQKIEEELSKISSDVKLGTEKNVEKRYEFFQSPEVVLPCRRENNDEEESEVDEEESEVDDLSSMMGSSNRILEDGHEFLVSNFQDIVVGCEENKF